MSSVGMMPSLESVLIKSSLRVVLVLLVAYSRSKTDIEVIKLSLDEVDRLESAIADKIVRQLEKGA
jgi:hypothetical protein